MYPFIFQHRYCLLAAELQNVPLFFVQIDLLIFSLIISRSFDFSDFWLKIQTSDGCTVCQLWVDMFFWLLQGLSASGAISSCFVLDASLQAGVLRMCDGQWSATAGLCAQHSSRCHSTQHCMSAVYSRDGINRFTWQIDSAE